MHLQKHTYSLLCVDKLASFGNCNISTQPKLLILIEESLIDRVSSITLMNKKPGLIHIYGSSFTAEYLEVKAKQTNSI